MTEGLKKTLKELLKIQGLLILRKLKCCLIHDDYRISAIISRPYIYFLALLVRLLFKVLSIFLFLVL